jgi:hypothetical protein
LSTTNLPHYNQLLVQPWRYAGYRVVYQPSCLNPPYDGICWPIQYPEIKSWNNTVVIMHCQDFVSIDMEQNICPELEKIEKHFGDRANQVIVVHWNIDLHTVYNGSLNLVYFPTHSYELLLKMKKTFDEWKPRYVENLSRPVRFQCLNGIPRPHRCLVVDWLDKNNLNGIRSFGDSRSLENYEYTKCIGFNQFDNQGNWILLQPIYSQCDVNIVTETMYYENPGIITEKTLMAILAMQVPILIGYKGIVKHFEDLGFDVFRDIVNTEYDNFSNDTRWLTALESNRNLLVDPLPREDLESRLLANREHVLSIWPEQLVNNYNQAVTDIVKEIFPNLDKV